MNNKSHFRRERKQGKDGHKNIFSGGLGWGVCLKNQVAVPSKTQPLVVLGPERPSTAESAESSTGAAGEVQLGSVAATWLTVSFHVSA